MKNKGTVLGITAYVLWGLITLYWKLITGVSPLAIMCYRIIWSFVFMLGFIGLSGRWQQFVSELKRIWQNKKFAGMIILAAILISINWFTFIFTVSAGHVMEASLGYYINPLVNVLLATVFERTVESVGDDCLWFGSCWSDHAFGANWCDPLCFTDHGFFIQHVWSHQKHIPISSATGLTVETFVILPAALIYIFRFFFCWIDGLSIIYQSFTYWCRRRDCHPIVAVCGSNEKRFLHHIRLYPVCKSDDHAITSCFLVSRILFFGAVHRVWIYLVRYRSIHVWHFRCSMETPARPKQQLMNNSVKTIFGNELS